MRADCGRCPVPSRRRLRLAVAAATLLALLTGCASIPQSGSVHAAPPQNADDGLELDILARDPQAGASQAEILLGFIDAAASPQSDWETARKYLTSAWSDQWNPREGATVDRSADRIYASTGELSMSLQVTPLADVSTHGQYAESDSSAPSTLDYEFQKVKGQWRISKAPQGIVIDRPTFQLVFGAYPLYFFDPSFSYLVPDLRYFPRTLSTPAQVTRELLAGPSPWLAGAVVSAFPEGTSLTSDSVQVVSRTARVDLNAEALKADAGTLVRMKQQLTESLVGSVSTVGSVAISVNQIDQEVPDSSVNAATTDPAIDSRALVLRAGAFGFLAPTGDTIDPIAGISETVAALAPSAVTLGPGQSAAAVLSPAGVALVRAGNPAVPLDDRPNLIAPSVDGFGVVWSVPADAPGAMKAYAPDGSANAVATSWPDATRIIAFRLSRDGTRLIALIDTGAGSRLVAAAIVRGDGDKRQVPLKLGPPLTLANVAGSPRDIAWVDESTVVSLTAVGDGSTTIVTQQVGGPSDLLDGNSGATAIGSGTSVRDLRLLGGDGWLQQRRGIGWQPRIDGVVLLATQQGL
ncbi:LpqB family beta-propeller domain-containing protein [Rathayibacter sp. YIM 133350]|uniref:LpqB family beta-propeller domain-containing protein n=1 Tax=Rathayibacter sp. YIM 133350 TaxID=3131992 RepID=UPI00307D23F4